MKTSKIAKKLATLLMVILIVAFATSLGFAKQHEQRSEQYPSIAYEYDEFNEVIVITTENIIFEDVSGIEWNGTSIHEAVTTTVKEISNGFQIFLPTPENSSTDVIEGTLSIYHNSGITLSIPIAYTSSKQNVYYTEQSDNGKVTAQASCSWLNFDKPASGSISRNYGSKITCSNGKPCWHTGVDYSYGDGNARATANGTVSRIEYKWYSKPGVSDHGIGTNISIRHKLSNCSYIYSMYAHLASVKDGIYVGKTVSRGDKIGIIGGSGYGQSNYWSKHLHFEIKYGNVTSNPSGCSGYAANSYWGYVPYSNVDCFGYRNPYAFID